MVTQARNYYIGQKPISYNLTPGIKIWSNGMPIKADTYKSCSMTCSYCYARYMMGGMYETAGIKHNPRIARHINLGFEAKHFAKAYKEKIGWMYWAIRNKYYIELGTIGETFQREDKQMRHSWNFIQICGQYEMPLFINTKCGLLAWDDDYFKLIAEYPAPVILSISIMGGNDDLCRRFEPNAPSVTERLDVARRMRDFGIPTTIYVSPVLKGVTDVDTEAFVERMIDSGAVGAHVRNFFVTGKMMRVHKWKQYVEDNKEYMVRQGQGWRFKSSFMMEQYTKMQEHANKIDPRFQIVGMKSSWFELNPHHGKLNMDWMPERFKDGIIDFTAIPILRKIREKVDEPQILTWANMGFDADKINFPRAVPLAGGWNDEGAWLSGACLGCLSGRDFPRGARYMEGWKWLQGAIWSGLPLAKKGFMATVKGIYEVYDGDDFARTDDGNKLLAYVPLLQTDDYTAKGKVQLSSTVDFLQPRREGGTKDKWEATPELEYAL